MMVFEEDFKNKRILITGHTGFKGGWLSFWFKELGAEILGIGLDPIHKDSIFERANLKTKITDIRQDIRDSEKIIEIFNQFNPELVCHLAAQPIVRESYEDPRYTYECNINGTINILEAIRYTPSVKAAIMVTTDKVYRNTESIWGYREIDPLGGHDPYSASKAACEIIIESYRKSFFMQDPIRKVYCASVRAGNVIGGGDWQKDRLVPDCIQSLIHSKSIKLRNPKATRPWQHVLDALYGYLLIARKLMQKDENFADAWNIGPDYDSLITVQNLAERISQYWNEKTLSSIKANIDQSKRETIHLSLDITKAKSLLEWNPVLSLKETIEMTVDWYKSVRNPKMDMEIVSRNQIEYFTSKLSHK